jgi:hypothetical protein
LGELHPKFIDLQRAVALAGDAIAREEAILDGADRLRGLVQCGSISLQDAVDGLLDIGRANSLLTGDIEAEIGHRLRGEIDAWRAAAVKDHRNRPPTRSDAPASLSDYAAWAEFDRCERERPAPPTPRQRPTLQVTVQAILYAVSKRGLAALKEPAVRKRAERCDAAAREQINQRIARLLAKGEI